MSASALLVDSLPQTQRLALAYAPGAMRERLAGLLSLDARLGAIVRNSREPMLAQLRLAWWREQLSGDASAPAGEPLLGALECWQDGRRALAGLADGWEAMTGEAPLPPSAFGHLAEARARAFVALAGADDPASPVERMARNWALVDIAARLSHPEERAAARALALRQDWSQASLSRRMRPLAMLHAVASRNLVAGQSANALSPKTALIMVRIGLLGR